MIRSLFSCGSRREVSNPDSYRRPDDPESELSFADSSRVEPKAEICKSCSKRDFPNAPIVYRGSADGLACVIEKKVDLEYAGATTQP